jgi:hypothetical protein
MAGNHERKDSPKYSKDLSKKPTHFALFVGLIGTTAGGFCISPENRLSFDRTNWKGASCNNDNI